MLLLLLACTAPPTPHHKILWISMDTVSAEHLALYGGPAKLPALESLGGRVYDHAFSHFPETAVSHWTMLSGVLPDVHGDVPRHAGSAYTGLTMAELAKQNGYTTGAFIGGITLKNGSCGLGRGFDVYDDRFGGELRPAGEVAQAATRWIGQQQGDWFAFVHFFDAHFPYEPKDPRRYDPDYTGPFDGTDRTLQGHRDFADALPERDLAHVEALYHAEITELDGPLQQVLASLKGDEVVVVTADHGESFGHGYFFNHRAAVYDEVLHVPLVIRAPGLEAGHDPQLMGLVDVMPTVAKLAGLALPDPIAGHTPRAVVGSHTDPFMPPSWFSMRSAGKKVIWGPEGQRGYDLVADPHELAPTTPDPELVRAKDDYEAAVATMKRWSKAITSTREISADERARLEALGYTVPSP